MSSILTDVGKAKMIDGLYGTALTAPTYIGWGTGTTDAAHGDTALETPAAEARTNGTKSKVTTTVLNDTYKVAGSVACTGAPKTITEVGLFDASTVGNLYVRGVFTGIDLAVTETILFTITIQQE